MPDIVEHPDRPYVGVRKTITMTTFGVVADRIAELIGWLAERGVGLAGAPFLRYHSIDMEADGLDVEAGVPVAAPVEGEGDIRAGVLPAGRYATVTHHGHPDQLAGVMDELLKWASGQGLKWDMTESGTTEHWGCRLELYQTDPRVQPDPAEWDTVVEFRLA
ncbi:GyrI-like domain-containing protein [Nonomuraea muscovyensis]|uniref:Effector-binding domain-containing protein n=1 Tax=Nonomuraea muscovyensis TaxID=1124761 RepID=A0A7X0EZV6_9ACTN|nr:GyrI-like domain-containing protein [Nonomuraea muscovyensis]MBB6350627.1 effector-binding domain-containing protein [Nonomuraea muscovyensis]